MAGNSLKVKYLFSFSVNTISFTNVTSPPLFVIILCNDRGLLLVFLRVGEVGEVFDGFWVFGGGGGVEVWEV